MNQIAVASDIFFLNIRWCFWLGFMILVDGAMVLSYVFAHKLDFAAVDLGLCAVLTVTSLLNVNRWITPYTLSLPISTRTLYLSALCSAVLTTWLPVIPAVVMLGKVNPGHDAYAVPLACGALWTAFYCLFWLLRAQAAPLSSVLLVSFTIQLPLAFWWLIHPPSVFTVAALLGFSIAASVFTWLRLPAVLKSAEGAPPVGCTGRLPSTAPRDYWSASGFRVPA